MRRGLTLWQWLLLLLVLIGAVAYFFTHRAPSGKEYAVVERATLGAGRTGIGLIVREEIPYDADGVTNISYISEEGRDVAVNDRICSVFSSGYSTREMSTLQTYRDAIRDYQIRLIAQETTYDASLVRLEQDVLTQAEEVRAILAGARGSLSNQEKILASTIAARQQYLKKKYASDQRLTRLYDDETAQTQRIDSWTKTYFAAREGIVSFYTDMFEYGLTTTNYTTFTPAEIRRMIGGALPDGSGPAKGRTTLYRLVTSDTWHLLLLADNAGWEPVKNESYPLLIDGDSENPLVANVEEVVRSGGEMLVRLTIVGDVRRVLYMRNCSAILSDYQERYKVPNRAIYHQNDMDGVVITSGDRELFIPVKVLLREGNDAYIWPENEEMLSEGTVVRLF